MQDEHGLDDTYRTFEDLSYFLMKMLISMACCSACGMWIFNSNNQMALLQDLLVMLRPSLERLGNYEAAAAAVAAIQASEERSAAAPPGGLGTVDEEESDDENGLDNSGSDDENEGMLNPLSRPLRS